MESDIVRKAGTIYASFDLGKLTVIVKEEGREATGIKNLRQKSVIYLGLPILSLVCRLNCRSMC